MRGVKTEPGIILGVSKCIVGDEGENGRYRIRQIFHL